MRNKFQTAWQTTKNLGPLGPLMLFTVLAPGLGLLALLSTSETWLSVFGSLNETRILVYFACAVLLAGLSLIPTHACSLIAGMLFGIIQGPIIALFAVVTASCFSFVVVKLIVQEGSYQALLRKEKTAEIHQELLLKSGYKAVLFISFIRLSPIMPFAATNVLLAASQVKTSLFLMGSFIGLSPRIILVAIAGAGLSELDLSKSSNIWLAIVGGVSTVILLAYIGKVVQKVSGAR